MFTCNRIQLTGNIAKSPKTGIVGNVTVVRTRLIHNERSERAGGEAIERLTAVEIEIWGKRGEAFAEHVTTRTPVYIEGKLQLAEWDKNGERLFRHFIRVTDWQFLLPKPSQPKALAA